MTSTTAAQSTAWAEPSHTGGCAPSACPQCTPVPGGYGSPVNATLEGRTEKLKNPLDPSSLAWYAWIAARLGGWSSFTSKGYKPAGSKIMARGLKKLGSATGRWGAYSRV